MAMEMLDREFREDQSAILSNEISRCMIQNNMTLENLDEASKIVVNVGKDTNVPSNDGWIPVEERLPEDCKEIVLVQVSGKPADNILFDNAFEFALYEKEEGWMLDNYPEWKNPDVIAWQPLPEPYRRFKKELS